jgi:hypothetical protein
MLSVNYIADYLSKKHYSIDGDDIEKIKPFELKDDVSVATTETTSTKPKFTRFLDKIDDSFDFLFSKKNNIFYVENIIYRNNSSVFSFVNSILTACSQEAILLKEVVKEDIVKDFLKKIGNDLFEHNLYNRFLYHKNKKINKSDIQKILGESFTFKYDETLIHILQQYIVDYLGINVFIFAFQGKNIDFMNSNYVLSSYFDLKTNPYLPSVILFKIKDIYRPVLSYDGENCVFLYSKNKEIIDNLWKYFKLEDISSLLATFEAEKDHKFNVQDLKKMKIDELKNECIKYEIAISKKSDKTAKMINKTKNELLEDLISHLTGGGKESSVSEV